MSSEQLQGRERIVIRIGRHHLSFSSATTTQSETPITYEPYIVKSGMSIAANLREALKGASLTQTGIRKALVMIDAPILLVPVELFEESKVREMYEHSFPSKEQTHVLYNVLPDLNAVATYAINKDLKLVLDDNFNDMKIIPTLSPVWRHLHKRSFTGARQKLYGYFHDNRLDIFSYQQNRFKFYNQFDATHVHDALYFLVYVWKQLLLNPEHDELHLVGDVPQQEWFVDELRKYLQKVYVINPAVEFKDAPATKVKGMPFDLMTLFTKGR